MPEVIEVSLDRKLCPICSQDLPLLEYGICRARKDGRNLYCKSCIRKKVSESRRAFKAYKTVRHQYVAERSETHGNQDTETNGLPARRHYITRQVSQMTPTERVREAIRNGARTQSEIAQGTKMSKDEIGDALANLLLWTREVRTEVIDSERRYFINEVAPEPMAYREEGAAPKLPQRKGDVASSFSGVRDLMPGKKGEDKPERAPGWVAA